MSDCLFCKIINKTIAAEIVYEDEHVLAFLDINPIHPGHTLVVPKVHAATFMDMEEQACASVAPTIKKLMSVLTHELGYDGANLIQNNGTAAGQVIAHVHFHVIPRKVNDGFVHWHGQAYGDGQTALWAAKIRESLEVTD